jgi:signal peptidase I
VTTGWVIVLLVGTITGLVLRLVVLQPFSVTSSAMVPVLHKGDHIVVVTSSLLTGPVRRGDIVVFRQPAGAPCTGDGPSDDVAERVVGLPGETVGSLGQVIYIDGRPLKDSTWYDHQFGRVNPGAIVLTTLGPDDYFMLGANPENSCDSRSFGAVPRSSILGRAVAVVMRGGRPYLHSLS